MTAVSVYKKQRVSAAMTQRARYYYRRQVLRQFVKAFQIVFTRTTVVGKENIPRSGPYIAVGNHVAAIEVALMTVNLPHVVELMGNGDIPIDPAFGFIANWYQFIPIRRGSVDRRALQAACEVLNSGNVLGLFPEGGIWEHHMQSARPGVAWLSQQTGAPILPIGFSGARGALGKAMRLKRPRMLVSIGPLMPPVPRPASTQARKAAIEAASVEMMARIRSLVNDEQHKETNPDDEKYSFRVELSRPDGRPAALPDGLSIPYGEDLAFFFHRHVLLEVIYRNYKLTGAKPLSQYPDQTDPAILGAALDVALDFYQQNPAFLGYRLGYTRAGRVVESLTALRQVMVWAAAQGYSMRILPERTIMDGEVHQTFFAPSIKREY